MITHWLLQSDLRAFLSSHSPTPDRETFLLRFGGMRLDATLERSFRAALFVNLAQNQVFLLEGWIEASLAPGVQLRAGKILYPISEERLTPGINLPFVSTSVAAMLLPARDTGVELFGSLAGDRIFWNLNWYPSREVALLVTYGHQVFAAADSAPARPDEDTSTARFQLIL